MKILMAEALDWNNVFQVGSHAYARRFRDSGWTVGWISHPWHPLHLLKDWLQHSDTYEHRKTVWRKGGQWEEGIFSYAPMTLLPYRKSLLLGSVASARLSQGLIVPPLRRTLRGAGFGHVDVLWVTNPFFAGLSRRTVAHRLLVYRMADEVSGFSFVPPSLRVLEEDILCRSDIVFATARSLAARAREFNDNVYYLPNAGPASAPSASANGCVQRSARPDDSDMPADIRSFPSPRIVYVGAMSEWFDRDVLLHCALALPMCSFVLIGPKPPWARELSGRANNIHFLGPRRQEAIPGYLSHCQVGIIPFVLNRLTHSVHPLKLYEYLAAGLPVVSADLDEVRGLGAPVLLADSAPGFAARIAEALATGPRKDDIEHFLAANSWDARFCEVQRIIYERLRGERLRGEGLERARGHRHAGGSS